ncbi:MAG: hypothetical protein ABI600_10020 [Luteolibacter sp.]
MKNTTTIKRPKRLTATALLCAGSFLFNSCTTTNTAYQVQTQPMNPALEKQILRETSLSGMAIGAVAGAVAGGVLGAVYGAINHHDKDQMGRDVTIGIAGGAVVGAGTGHQKGKQQGQEMVSAGMTRDKASELVKAARQENQRLAAFNAGLKRKITSAKAIKDASERKIALVSLKSQTVSYNRDADTTIAMRKKALETKNWGKGTSGAREKYQACTNDMIQQQKALASMAAVVEQSIVY